MADRALLGLGSHHQHIGHFGQPGPQSLDSLGVKTVTELLDKPPELVISGINQGGNLGTDGLVHISQICERRIQTVRDEIQEGDEIMVKVIDVDRNGKVKLSRKEAMRDEAAAATH